MKTGRVRKKEAAPQVKPAAPKPAAPRPAVRPVAQAQTQPAVDQGYKPANAKIVTALLVGLFACFALTMIVFTALGGRQADDWVPATRADGQWTTTVKVWGPQATHQELWEADCRRNPQATVQPGTCIVKDTPQYRDQMVDEYAEYAYHIYYEETYHQVYQAQGTEFAVIGLGSDDWWDQDRHYVLQEELDSESCQYTDYTVWVDDPDDATHEIEVYLSECEVWDRVIVYQRAHEQGNWCGCDVVSVVELGQESQQGSGPAVHWPDPGVPAGGRTERTFQGTVTFQGDDHTFTATTDDLVIYQDYVTSQYYIGLDHGRPVRVSKTPR